MSASVSPGRGAGRKDLREAIAAADRARGTCVSPEAALGAWQALYEGHWAIVESVERDGLRFLVARPDPPLLDGELLALAGAAGCHRAESPCKLSAQESRVLVALAEGHSNKLIAYELGLATSTVGTLLARAARKLGCRNRIALARAGRDLTPPLASQRRTEEPE